VVKESHKSIIELNGQRYDAHTGALIQSPKAPPAAPKAFAMDMKTQSVSRAKTPSRKVHKTPEPSHTLMRHAVKKPSTITNRKTVAMDVVSPGPGAAIKQVFHATDPSRTKRAHSVPKLSLISRFGNVGSAKRAAHAPQQMDMITKPAAASHQPGTQALAPNHATSKTDKMLATSMRNADSHSKKHTVKKTHIHHRIGHKLGLGKKATSVVSGVAAVLVLGGFFAYQNIPSISVRYASAKAGVRAGLPGYQPAGFAVNSHVQYNPGAITISYHANADSRAYTLTQKNTTWNSQALKDHLATTTSSMPQSYPSNGQTIYLHDDSSADWVAGGVWYSISGNSSLSTDQLIKIATSI
jgi:hypothetical protein